MMKSQKEIFFDFLQFCIGATQAIPESLSMADWMEMYDIAKKQALIGVIKEYAICEALSK